MKRAAGAAVIIAIVLLSGCAGLFPPIVSPATSVALARPAGRGVVYLLRGGFNIFSTGMDELAEKLRADGVDARSEGHSEWREIAAEARDRYAKDRTPIILVGHSWGALAAVLIAMDLEKSNTPVALMILYDGTESVKISANVRRVINFVSRTNIGMGLTATGLPGFSGKLENIAEPAYDHINIDNAAPLHDASIAAILQVVHPAAGAVRR
jgi:pimeloyl-ACP methyl ester carboxylesterase